MISKNKKEDAVSPVVGVMLMLVVTIIIAAVVAAFAGGLTETTTKTPIALIDVDGVSNENILMLHKGGDTFRLADVYLELKNGNDGIPTICKSAYSAGVDPCLLISADTGSSVSAGGHFEIANPGFSAGQYIDYRLIDLNSGNVITSGSMVIPSGVNNREPITTVAVSTWVGEMEGGHYADSLELTLNSEGKATATFYRNGYGASGNKINGASIQLEVTGGSDSDYEINQNTGVITFKATGSYTVSAKLDDAESKHIPETGGNMNDPSTLADGGISVTVNPASTD